MIAIIWIIFEVLKKTNLMLIYLMDIIDNIIMI